MSKSFDSPAEPSGESIEKRFLAVNSARLQRVYDSLSPRQREFLDVLPLLIHINHPLLPGYVTKDAPCGIKTYTPGDASLRAANRLCRSFEYNRRLGGHAAVRGLYMMGSPGTIAYSRTSDLDLWLVHTPDLDAKGLRQLTDKARRIERFAATLDLEVHFFVFDAERFRRGETLSLSEESSGSSQHSVLLDEFYRSSLLMAGLPPLWWRVPACHDCCYDAYVAAARVSRLVDVGNYIDFGGLPTIAAEEFFGAALWQLYKSIESPYKSVMKLLLMEAYAAEYPDITLLSSHYKQNVESGHTDLNAIDPYILMYTKAEDHLLARNDPLRLGVLRRCFYIKANLPLSERRGRTNVDWRVDLMRGMVRNWGWSENQIARLDARERWGLDIGIEERRDLTSTLKGSYAILSRFARRHTRATKITERDLHILGRKLYAAFEKKPSKIEVVTRGICSNPVEPSLSLHEVKSADNGCVWSLYIGAIAPGEAALRNPAKRSGSAAEIIVWCHVNRLASDTTTWHLFTTESRLNTDDVKRIRDSISAVLDQRDDDSADEMAQQPRVGRVLALVNVGTRAFAEGSSSGDILTSNLNDPLAFGTIGLNLVRAVDLLFVTTWHETFAFRYEGGSAVLEAAAELAQWLAAHGSHNDLPVIETRCLTSNYRTQIAERVDGLLNDSLRCMLQHRPDVIPHFIMQSEDQLHHLRLQERRAIMQTHPGQASLMRALAATDNAMAQQPQFDRSCTRAGLIPTIYPHNRFGAIQIFAQQRGTRADVYILDQRGALLVHRQRCDSMASLLEHYRRFLDTTLPRCHASAAPDGTTEVVEIETFEMVREAQGMRLQTYAAGDLINTSYLAVRVFADADSSGHQQFTIQVGEREFSTWEHGGSLFLQVAEYVLAQRRSGQSYPIYITDLDFSTRFRAVIGVPALRPYDLLSYKKRIEYQLARALRDDFEMNPSAIRLAS